MLSAADLHLLGARVEARLIPEPNTGCMLWLGSVNPKGYGGIGLRGKMYKVHRIAYGFRHGFIPDEFLLHKCDVPSCCNPDHLHPGNHQDNMAEMRARGRVSKHPRPKGEANGNAVLTAEKVREMRRRNLPDKEAALIYGCSEATAAQVRRRITWKGVE